MIMLVPCRSNLQWRPALSGVELGFYVIPVGLAGRGSWRCCNLGPIGEHQRPMEGGGMYLSSSLWFSSINETSSHWSMMTFSYG